MLDTSPTAYCYLPQGHGGDAQALVRRHSSGGDSPHDHHVNITLVRECHSPEIVVDAVNAPPEQYAIANMYSPVVNSVMLQVGRVFPGGF